MSATQHRMQWTWGGGRVLQILVALPHATDTNRWADSLPAERRKAKMLYVRFIHKHLGIVSFENVVRVWWVPSTKRNPGDSIAVKVKCDSVEKHYLVENVSDFECRPTPAPADDLTREQYQAHYDNILDGVQAKRRSRRR